MRKLFLIIIACVLSSCNGQEQNSKQNKSTSIETNNMQKIDINFLKQKAISYMKNQNEEGENIQLDSPYYFFKETTENNKNIEFSGDDKEGYSIKETLPKPNIYNKIKFYRTNGNILYSFKTLIINPNIVIGEHIEFDELGKIVKTKNYDEGFKTSPEKIIVFIQSRGGNIENELTIVDRSFNEGKAIWHVEFLVPNEKVVKILTVEDSTLKILKTEERASDFLKD